MRPITPVLLSTKADIGPTLAPSVFLSESHSAVVKPLTISFGALL